MDLTNTQIYDGRGSKPARAFLVVLSDRLRGNGRKLKYRRMLKHKKNFLVRQQVAPRGCEVPFKMSMCDWG